MDWLDLLAVQGTLKSLLQHHSSTASILQHSVFFIVYLSHPYMTTGKTITLTRRTFVAGSQCEDLPLWQRSWGRRLGICKGGIEPQETPCSPASTPKNQRLPTLLLYFLGSKITADGDCSHEIKRLLFLGRKAMTNLDSLLKIRNITLPTKVHLVKAMVFPVVMYGCER